MKNSTAFFGKNAFSSPYSCAASVLLCDRTIVGRPSWAITCAIVMVLAEPVTPSSVWSRSPRARPSVSSAMARGWSPAGWWGETSSKGMGGKLTERQLGVPARIAAGDLRHALHLAHGAQHLVQVGVVLDLHQDGAEDGAVFGRQVGALDVRPRPADRLADVRVEP